MKTIAIIGSGSMLGTELVRQLRKKNCSVICVGRASHNNIVFDLTGSFDADSCKGLQADILIHCASSFEEDTADNGRKNFLTNAFGCLNVLSLMHALSCKICFYTGTVNSYNNFEYGQMKSYGLSKAQGEEILEWGINRVGGQFCSLRFTAIYDTEGKCCKHQPWFGRIVAYASRGINLRLPDSAGVRNYLHVVDAARIMIRALEFQLSGCWPVCHTEQIDHAEIARLAYAEFSVGGKVLLDRNKLPFRKRNYPSSSDLFNRLKITPAISIAQGLEMINHAGTEKKFGPLDVQ